MDSSGNSMQLQSVIYEVWQYAETTVYDLITDSGGLFAQYMNTFTKIKMEASGSVQRR